MVKRGSHNIPREVVSWLATVKGDAPFDDARDADGRLLEILEAAVVTVTGGFGKAKCLSTCKPTADQSLSFACTRGVQVQVCFTCRL